MIALQARIETNLAVMENWLKSNSLKMNPDKTKFMLVGTRANINKTNNFHLDLGESTYTI